VADAVVGKFAGIIAGLNTIPRRLPTDRHLHLRRRLDPQGRGEPGE